MTNGHQLIAILPADLPSPLANKLAVITGCCYGIKQANHEYDNDLINLLTSGGVIVPGPGSRSYRVPNLPDPTGYYYCTVSS